MASTTWESFLSRALEYLNRQQDRLTSKFEMSRWSRYDYDQGAATLTFSLHGRIGVVADIHMVGSTSKSGGTWLWAWDNSSILASAKHYLNEVRTFGETHGLEKLTTAKWPGDERDGWEMTAAASLILQAEGGYRVPNDNGALFMILRNVRMLADPTPPDDPLPPTGSAGG